jgi:ABC-type dipeptide/oligopeptide/nickel transport system permease component
VLKWLVQRLLYSSLVILAVVFVVSMVTRMIPGDPVDVIYGAGWTGGSEADKERLREQLGLTSPPLVQFGDYLGDALRGDLGTSIHWRTGVSRLIAERLPATLELAVAAVLVSLVTSIPMGIATALKKDTLVDFLGSVFSLLGISIPGFLMGILFILALSVWLRLLPSFGETSSVLDGVLAVVRSGDSGPLVDSLRHLILPALSLGLPNAAINARVTRSAMLETLKSDYVQFAKAKGLPGHRVILKHAFRNALIPPLTVLGLQMGSLISGAVVIENVFAWPGVGRLVVEAVSFRDYPVIQGTVLLTAVSYSLINIALDIAYRIADPRIKYE